MNKILSRIGQVLILSIFIFVAGGLNSCEKYQFNPPAIDPNYPWSLSTEIQPLFNDNCISCHGGTVSPDLRETASYNSLSRGGYVDAPGESSRLNVKITTDPDHANKLTDSEKLQILYWIQQGAKDN